MLHPRRHRARPERIRSNQHGPIRRNRTDVPSLPHPRNLNARLSLRIRSKPNKIFIALHIRFTSNISVLQRDVREHAEREAPEARPQHGTVRKFMDEIRDGPMRKRPRNEAPLGVPGFGVSPHGLRTAKHAISDRGRVRGSEAEHGRLH